MACGAPRDYEIIPIAPTAAPLDAPAAETNAPVSLTLSLAMAELSENIPAYDRDDWGQWTDADLDCQDTRQEALIAASNAPVEFERGGRCRVAAGGWIGRFTGVSISDPNEAATLHTVPLANAHESGGWRWTAERKTAYANSLDDGQIAVASPDAARARANRAPHEWRPADPDSWCQYALDWIAVKRRWGLTATEDEAAELSEMVDACDIPVFFQTVRAEPGAAASPTAAPTLTPPPTASPASSPPPAPSPTPAVDDRDCSDFDDWEAAQDFFLSAGGPDVDPHRLDVDGDGIACASLRAPPAETPRAAPLPTAAPTPTPFADKDCADFGDWQAAQAFYEAAGGPDADPHRLDRDGDGIACASLRGAP